ncbi:MULTISPECIES: L,D-transpeptidase family protein [Streptomycetaceae]|nr:MULTISPECIES: L,D-transpeptidase [Streptomycetaceae]MYS62302.1 L,D-transpeptidase family protein [Streptomyces sp. SID5468]CCB78208.1 putative secreted protein [Streptantibioticus cattleyicolor NRRL 8057 = DSM 46488]
MSRPADMVRRISVGLGAAVLAVPAAVLAAPAAQAATPGCTTKTGPYQKQVERFLGRPVDGRQSAADCRAIRSFQVNHEISPAIGYAGPVTWAEMQRITRWRATVPGRCPVNRGRIACVDLTRQLSWVQDGRKLVYGPVPVRTGRAGFVTRTGPKKIYWRDLHHWSTIYHVAMPYSQFFDGGEAFHSIAGNVYSPPGSHGCVNMRPSDAKAYWNLLRTGSNVFVYGRKPGT